MHFTTLLLTTLFTLLAIEGVAASQCRIGQQVKDNCCWGGRGGGSYLSNNEDACNRQKGGMGNPDNICYDGGESANHCANNGLVKEDCDADCCDTITKWGTGCPK